MYAERTVSVIRPVAHPPVGSTLPQTGTLPPFSSTMEAVSQEPWPLNLYWNVKQSVLPSGGALVSVVVIDAGTPGVGS